MGIFSQAKRVSQSRLNIHIEDLDGTHRSRFRLPSTRLLLLVSGTLSLHLGLLLRGGLASILLLLGFLGRPASSLGLFLLLVVRLGRHGEYLLLSLVEVNQAIKAW